MKKTIFVIMSIALLAGCSNKQISQPSVALSTKPVWCWQLPPTEQQPSVNCIGQSSSN